jgi:hypothetical protein
MSAPTTALAKNNPQNGMEELTIDVLKVEVLIIFPIFICKGIRFIYADCTDTQCSTSVIQTLPDCFGNSDHSLSLSLSKLQGICKSSSYSWALLFSGSSP